MKRLFAFVLKLAFLVALAVWLADRPGAASITWHGYVIETSAAFLGVAVIAAGFVIYFLLRFWRFLKNGPEMWRLRRQLNKVHEGQRRLTEGLIAVAAGDAAEAGRLAVASRKLLGVIPATQLLQAQAAQLAGDRSSAREIFLALAGEPESAVLGYRGLIMEALRAGDREEAERLTEKLRRLRPETPWLSLVRFELAARRRAWIEAGDALEHAATARLMEPAHAKRHRAAMLIAIAQDEARQGNQDKALQAAEQALRLAPGWTPAAIALAQRQLAAGHKRAAYRTIERAWGEAPHPQLAAVYRADGNADPVGIYKKIEHLCRNDEDRPLSRLVLAEAALEAGIWGEARRHLLALAGRGEATKSAYRLLARLERGENGDEKAASQWLARAIDASPDPVWLCRVCGGAHEEWQAVCRHCGAFGGLEWQTPGQSRANAETPAGLLASGWAD